MENRHSCVHQGGHHLENHNRCVSLAPIFNHLEEGQMDEIMNTVRSLIQ